jgi:glycosyltransferase involved in cell wall biosynthesis
MKYPIDEVFIFSLWYYPSHFAIHIDDIARAFASQGVRVTIVTIAKNDYNLPYFQPFKHMFIEGDKDEYDTIRLSVTKLFDRNIYNPIVFFGETADILEQISARSKQHRVALFHFFDTFVPYFNKTTLPEVKASYIYYAGNFITRTLRQLGSVSGGDILDKLIIDINMSHILKEDGTIDGIDFLVSQTDSFIKMLSAVNPSLPAFCVNRPFDIEGALKADFIDLRDKYNLPTNCKLLIYAGRPTKNVEALLEILKLVRKQMSCPVYLFIIGTQNFDVSQWRNFKTEKEFIICIDYLERPILYNYIKSCDTFVYSGLIDGQPKVVNESQAIGTPVVAFYTKSSSIDEIVVNNQTGILIPEGDNDLFANRVADLLNDDEKRNLLIKTTQKFVTERYSNQSFLNSLLK